MATRESCSEDQYGVAHLASIAREVYARSHGIIKQKQKLRPYICPLHVLVNRIPPRSKILDVGCGAGLFIALLVRLRHIESALGFDSDQSAIRIAQEIACQRSFEDIRFEHRNVNDPWPAELFDAVCMIDVMHHVAPEHQRALLATAADHVAPGGILLYKDMAQRPLWRAWANRIHDMVSVGEWIHYAPITEVISWAERNGLSMRERGAINMLWYRHEWCVLHRAA